VEMYVFKSKRENIVLDSVSGLPTQKFGLNYERFELVNAEHFHHEIFDCGVCQ